jgi:DNA-binding NtrC family response regulator
VLFVDDDVSLLSATRRALARESYAVETLSSAEEALEYLAKNRVDVVVSDHDMPGMSGVELLSRMRRLTPDTARILMSGVGDRSVLTDAINLGAAAAFLEKPVSLETLRKVLDASLAQVSENSSWDRIEV